MICLTFPLMNNFAIVSESLTAFYKSQSWMVIYLTVIYMKIETFKVSFLAVEHACFKK